MADDLDPFMMMQHPTAERPLLGLTVLVVEDSRFACEALRLLCLRSGARIRRAASLTAARRHLKVYRPSAVIIDLGLPDGSGADLINELANAHPRAQGIIGMSGDPDGEAAALKAGADRFLDKPIGSLAEFQSLILSVMPEDAQPVGLRQLSDDIVHPDPLALMDDLAHVADILTAGSDDNTLDYVAQFLAGVARSAGDEPLEKAASSLATRRMTGTPYQSDVARIAGLVQDRLGARQAI
ncbi:response regulator [Aliiroseovarius sp. PTFE2010]|uniref:response regulator n=1 Tax=Aliiroseovarius sp. PTFE2010 TaxID=3417190 RepID=UPI003CF163B2